MPPPARPPAGRGHHDPGRHEDGHQPRSAPLTSAALCPLRRARRGGGAWGCSPRRRLEVPPGPRVMRAGVRPWSRDGSGRCAPRASGRRPWNRAAEAPSSGADAARRPHPSSWTTAGPREAPEFPPAPRPAETGPGPVSAGRRRRLPASCGAPREPPPPRAPQRNRVAAAGAEEAPPREISSWPLSRRVTRIRPAVRGLLNEFHGLRKRARIRRPSRRSNAGSDLLHPPCFRRSERITSL